MSKDAAIRIRAKHWVLTVNNYSDEDCSQFEDIKELATYWVYGKETGDSGTKHLQCYIAFKKTMELTRLKRYWPRGHFEVMATKKPQHAADYCKKGDQSHNEWSKLGATGPNFGINADFREYGEVPGPQNANGGKETKKIWEEVNDAAKRGAFEEIPPNLLIPNYGNFKKYYFDYQPRPEDLDAPCGEWIWGPPGVGKSYTARRENPSYYDKMLNKWWDQYDGEECILLDDFELDHCCFGHHLKRWADQYAFTAEVKNHTTNIRPKKIVVTSNYHPKDIWSGAMLEAILRRFKIREILVLEKFDKVKLKTGKKVKKRMFESPVTPYTSKKFKQIDEKIVPVTEDKDPQKKIQWDYLSHPDDVIAYNESKMEKNEKLLQLSNMISDCTTTESYDTSSNNSTTEEE